MGWYCIMCMCAYLPINLKAAPQGKKGSFYPLTRALGSIVCVCGNLLHETCQRARYTHTHQKRQLKRRLVSYSSGGEMDMHYSKNMPKEKAGGKNLLQYIHGTCVLWSFWTKPPWYCSRWYITNLQEREREREWQEGHSIMSIPVSFPLLLHPEGILLEPGWSRSNLTKE